MLLEAVEQLCSLIVGRRGAECSHRSSLRPRCSLLARSARGAFFGLALLVTHSPDDQFAGEKACLFVHLFCAFVGSVISFADVVSDLQASPGTRLLAPDPCFP